jgi:hypothetical protein
VESPVGVEKVHFPKTAKKVGIENVQEKLRKSFGGLRKHDFISANFVGKSFSTATPVSNS